MNKSFGRFTPNRSCSPATGCPPLQVNNVAENISENCDSNFTPATTGITKVDVVLGTATVQIAVESLDTLPFSGRTLKQIRKNVHLTECKVLMPSQPPFIPQLFVEGYVHKNIQYSDSSTSFLRDHEVNVPFHCTVPLPVGGVLNNAVLPVSSDKNVFNNQYIELAKNEMEGNRCVTGGVSRESFNEPIRCELDAAFTNEYDILENFDRFGQFNTVREKMEVILIITLFQRQIICPNGTAPCNGVCCPTNAECIEGVCTCPRGTADCGNGVCVDVLNNPLNCGTCGNVCASGLCINGVCEPQP